MTSWPTNRTGGGKECEFTFGINTLTTPKQDQGKSYEKVRKQLNTYSRYKSSISNSLDQLPYL